MRTHRLRTPKGILLASLIALLTVVVGWFAVRATAASTLNGGTPLAAGILPGGPDLTLGRATAALVQQRGILSPAMLTEVRQAALSAPLDARPFLILGHQSLLEGQAEQALKRLEFGQRLDPRQRLIHILLLDRYLRTGRYRDAAAQFAVLSRLVGEARGPIASAVAQMGIAPETRLAVRRTLRSDFQLEQAVLMTLAKSDTDPALITSLASPAAWAVAGLPDSWGPVLIRRMVDQGRIAAARAIWQRIFQVPAAQLTTPLYDAGFRGLSGSPPFNWALTASGLGAADLRGGQLAIDYYGRDTGPLASQMILLTPGRYNLAFTLGGSPGAAGPTLSWSLTCVGKSGATLMDLALPPVTATRRRVAKAFTVPERCAAQRLTLMGNAAEFPAPINATISDLSVQRAGSPQ